MSPLGTTNMLNMQPPSQNHVRSLVPHTIDKQVIYLGDPSGWEDCHFCVHQILLKDSPFFHNETEREWS